MSWEVAGAWVAVGLTLAILSFLYRDNPLFKFAEHLYIGVGIGYNLPLNIFETYEKKLWIPLTQQGDWSLLIPVALGLLILTRFVPSHAWLSRWTFALIVGFAAGTSIPLYVHSNILHQIQGTIQPIPHRPAGGFGMYGWSDLGVDVSNLLVIAGVLSVLIYFFYSIEHKGPVRWIAKLGTLFLMVSFGASFGYTVMARISLLYGRCYDLHFYGGREYGYATPVLLICFVAFLAVYNARHKEQGPSH